MNAMTVFLIALALIGVTVAILFNMLVQRRQLVNNGWSDIDVQLKRRADLIPSLVTTVKEYAKHERDLFSEIIEKRTAAMTAGDDPEARSAAESALAKPVSKLFAVAEDYPELKASENFLDLQRQLGETEDKIEMARRFYNGAVRQMNTLVQSFPVNLMASGLGFAERRYFEIDASDRATPSIDLDGGAV